MNTAIDEAKSLNHSVVSNERWLSARQALLVREKELMRLQDQIARERRALPWERVEKNYIFDTSEGKRSLGLVPTSDKVVVERFFDGNISDF